MPTKIDYFDQYEIEDLSVKDSFIQAKITSRNMPSLRLMIEGTYNEGEFKIVTENFVQQEAQLPREEENFGDLTAISEADDEKQAVPYKYHHDILVRYEG